MCGGDDLVNSVEVTAAILKEPPDTELLAIHRVVIVCSSAKVMPGKLWSKPLGFNAVRLCIAYQHPFAVVCLHNLGGVPGVNGLAGMYAVKLGVFKINLRLHWSLCMLRLVDCNHGVSANKLCFKSGHSDNRSLTLAVISA